VKVFVSDQAVEKKVKAMRALGAEVEFVPGGYELAEATALKYAGEHGLTWVSPYNDPQVIAGQGTVGLEIAEQIALGPQMSVVAPAGGGGLVAGLGAALSGLAQRPRLVAAQPEASVFLYALFNGGKQEDVVETPTLADGLTGAVEAGSLTIPLARQYIQQFALVSEAEIAHAIAFAWRRYGQVIEASAAVGLAAVLSGKVPAPAVVIISGGNIQPALHAEILARNEAAA
jgi:threonine dehydratase